jgi:hypothetical protein
MTKYWLASVSVLAMTAGPALAQSLSSETTVSSHSTTLTPAPSEVVRTTKTEKSVDSNGVETNKGQTFTNGPSGTTGTATTLTTSPDGTPLTSSHRERHVSPNGDTTTTNETSATTPGR